MPVYADALELYMLDLINEERTSRGLNPLQLETNLNASAEAHSQWMLQANVFSHTGDGNSTATQRINAEFDLSGSWRTAENIAIQSERGASGLTDDVANLHTSLMNSPGHRANLLNPNLVYIGIGVEFGDFVYDNSVSYPSVIVTQNFAATQGSVDLDTGMGAIPQFTNGADEVTLTEAGIYFTLGGDDIVLGTASGETINGGTGNDELFGNAGNDFLNGDENNDRLYDGSGDDTVSGGSGNDYFRVGGGVDNFDGGSGKDYISYYDSSNGIRIDLREDEVSGSWAVNDTIKDFESASGSKTGNDTMLGTSGANTLRGYGGDDKLYGRGGSDKLYGGDGEDFLDGGGGSGKDLLYGGADADVFHFDRGEGIDVIKDFENNVDIIELDNFSLSKTQAIDLAEQVGSDVVFDFGADGILTVEDTTIGMLVNDLEMV
jgi:Ca2+-binding RTX toxin-like protein